MGLVLYRLSLILTSSLSFVSFLRQALCFIDEFGVGESAGLDPAPGFLLQRHPVQLLHPIRFGSLH